MENKLKLSSFLGGHDITYINGVKQIKSQLTGTVKLLEIYEIENGTLEIHKILQEINKLTKGSKDFIDEMVDIQYDIIKLVTNVDIDITREEFVQGVNNNDSMLLDFVKDVQTHFNRLTNDLIELSKNIKDIQKVLPQKSELEQKKDAFNVIEKAYDEEKDTKVKKQYLLQIAKLTEEIDKLEKEENKKIGVIGDGNEVNEVSEIKDVKLSEIGLNDDKVFDVDKSPYYN